MKEPTPLSLEDPSSEEGREGIPRPLVFKEAELMDTKTKAHSSDRSSDEPRALELPSSSPSQLRMNSPKQLFEPGALSLPDSSSLTIVEKPMSSPNSISPALNIEWHGSQGVCEATAKKLEPTLFTAEETRIRKCIRELLPITLNAVQDFGDRVLMRSREYTDDTSGIVRGFVELNAAQLLDEAVKSAAPKTGFFSKIAAQFKPAENFRPRVEALETAIKEGVKKLQALQTPVNETGTRLAIHLLAMRAVEQNTGKEPDNVALTMLNRRLDLFQAALLQANITKAQLDQTLTLMVSLESRCEYVLNVSLSVLNLTSAMNQSQNNA